MAERRIVRLPSVWEDYHLVWIARGRLTVVSPEVMAWCMAQFGPPGPKLGWSVTRDVRWIEAGEAAYFRDAIDEIAFKFRWG